MSNSEAGLFLATDALIFRVIHYAFSNQIWKKAPPHTTQGAGRYQIWVKTPSTQDLVPAGTKPILYRRSQREAPTKLITPKIPILF